MKKIQPWVALMGAAVLLASSAQAGYYDRGGRYEYHERLSHHNGANWVVPLVIGGVLGYALSEPRRESVTYVQSSPVIYEPQPIYQERWVYFSDCDCQRKVLVPIR
jgi:hypothetical protein